MDEQATFEARAVLAPRRARRARLVLLLPVVALAATAWAGVSGARSGHSVADVPGSGAVALSSHDSAASAPSIAPELRYPVEVLGLDVHRLENVRPRELGRDEVVAVAGWYVATEITDCPPLVAIYREAALPELLDDADSWAYCDRHGVLYAARPDHSENVPTSNPEDNRSRNAGPRAVAAAVVIGVVMPRVLEMVGADAMQVVVLGRFVPLGDRCRLPQGCTPQLVIDYVAWAAGD